MNKILFNKGSFDKFICVTKVIFLRISKVFLIFFCYTTFLVFTLIHLLKKKKSWGYQNVCSLLHVFIIFTMSLHCEVLHNKYLKVESWLNPCVTSKPRDFFLEFYSLFNLLIHFSFFPSFLPLLLSVLFLLHFFSY